MILTYIYLIFFTLCLTVSSLSRSYVERVTDPKEWKKLLRTRSNVLVLYANGRAKSEISNLFSEVSREARGVATLIEIDCSGDGKKLCKKNKVDIPNPYVIKHYNSGEFHKDYDRKETIQSMITFLGDPTGELPWDEDPIGKNIVHIADSNELTKLLKKSNPFMLMFYAPWCGFCKKLKPDYSSAATELGSTHILAAMDVNKPHNSQARVKYNITGFPTLIYFANGKLKYTYEGENNKVAIMDFMKKPGQLPKKPKEESWSDTPSNVVHLTDDSFNEFVKNHSSVLVMFYAPWCGHCKKMKPEFTAAADILIEKEIKGKLAAVDATKEKGLGKEFDVKGYPTIKYFKDAQFAYDVSNAREKDKIVSFLQDPKEPPPPPPPEKAWSEIESSVNHLHEENFKVFLKKKKHVLVMFYAPWCGHCKKAKPEFTGAADHYINDAKVEFAAVDCTVQQSICNLHDVHGYPTFKYFNYYKNTSPYNGGRSKDDFITFMADPVGAMNEPTPSASSPEEEWKSFKGANYLHHLTTSNFEDFTKNKEVLVMFYAPWCGYCTAAKADYSSAAEQLVIMGSRFGVLATVDATAEKALGTKYSIKGFPTFKYFRNGKEVREYNGAPKSKEFITFMKTNSRSRNEL